MISGWYLRDSPPAATNKNPFEPRSALRVGTVRLRMEGGFKALLQRLEAQSWLRENVAPGQWTVGGEGWCGWRDEEMQKKKHENSPSIYLVLHILMCRGI